MDRYENKLIHKIEHLKEEFDETTQKLIKELKRQDKIMARSDKRQKQEYDELVRLKVELEETQKEIVFIVGTIGEYRTKELGNHVKRVASYSYLLAKYYGLSPKECELLKYASPMHDIGKVAIADSILNKPGKLTNQERAMMQTHTQIGYQLLKNSERKLLQVASIIAYQHHEKYDGTGYPQGLKQEKIHIYGRITALADVFDALGSDRVYKKAWDDEKIFELIKEERGKHFDPVLVDIFFEHLDEFLEIRDKYR
jgi:response regulator RpfG family c-di-GMP phosphodiesterase